MEGVEVEGMEGDRKGTKARQSEAKAAGKTMRWREGGFVGFVGLLGDKCPEDRESRNQKKN